MLRTLRLTLHQGPMYKGLVQTLTPLYISEIICLWYICTFLFQSYRENYFAEVLINWYLITWSSLTDVWRFAKVVSARFRFIDDFIQISHLLWSFITCHKYLLPLNWLWRRTKTISRASHACFDHVTDYNLVSKACVPRPKERKCQCYFLERNYILDLLFFHGLNLSITTLLKIYSDT